MRRMVPVLAALAIAFPALGQSLDPRLLQDLQSRLGASAPGSVPASSSSQPDAGDLAPQVPGARVDTIEEQEVRRAEARRQLDDLYTPSPIERDYRQRLGDRRLRQFGYDFFQGGAPPTGLRTGAIGDDYVLGIGDEIQVAFRGATNASYLARVDRDGRIAIGQLPPIDAAGRTLGAVRSDIAAATRRTLLATETFVSVGNVRAISVFVGGEVVRPGQYNLTSLADIATALAQAGGIRRGGSLRQVRLVRAGGGTQMVDLYGLLGIGSAAAVRLRDGDRIIVPVIGPTVAVTGAVARPGIYELRGAASIGEVIAYAGGPIRQRGAQAVISRVAADGTESFLRAGGSSERVIGGDAVQVIGGSAGGVSGRVELRGNVDNPGPRPLLAARTVAELVGAAEDLRADTYQMAAILVRRDPETGARVLEPVALARELRGLSVTRLMSDDRLYLFSRDDIAFMNGVPVRQIVLGQPNPLPQCRSLVALSRLVRDTQTARFSAVTRGGFVVETATGAVVGAAGSALGGNAGRSLDRLVARDEEGGDTAFSLSDPARRRQDGQAQRRTYSSTEDSSEVPQTRCPEVFEELPDLLPVLLEHSVSVGGAVRRPGAYPVAGSVTARDLALLAEGLVGGAADLTLDVNRADDRPVEQVRADAGGTALVATSVGPGDDIRFNARQPLFEGSGVLLSGEVARPGLYAIRRGETLAQLLARAGGLTELSYAYGTVFTRRSVRQSQEEGFRRTARELNNSLLAVAARSNNSSGSGLAGAASLIQTLAQTDASGRMVVEGDPRVLAIRPDLDTVLEAGDAIHVPKRPNNVLVLGDVNNPGALQFVPGKSAGAYVNEAGGILATADRKRIFMVLPNGTAQPVALDNRIQPPPPGSTIIVPKNIDPLYRLSVIRDVTAIVSQLATSVATVAILATN